MRFVLRKGGPYYGPRGGKWADPEHTIPWGKPHPKALFHSAPVEAMESIQDKGLTPREGGGLFNHGSYDAHSQGKVFLSEHFDAAKNWHGKVTDMLQHNSDKEIGDKHAVMLRTKHRKTELDEVGNNDVEGSRYVKKPIGPDELEYFDKKHGWRPIEHWKEGSHRLPKTDAEAYHPGTEAKRELEQRAKKAADDARLKVESAKARAEYDEAEQKEIAAWAEKPVEEREAKAKELAGKKSVIPGASQLTDRWRRLLNVDVKGIARDTKEREVTPHAALGMHSFKLKVEKIDGETAHISLGGSTIPVPTKAVPFIASDLEGRVEGRMSDVPAINRVLHGTAKFLGKGDDGLVFQSGDQAVKVSTVVPYQPGNAFYKTPERAVQVAREQHETQRAMKAAGVPGLLDEKFVEHDGRGYTIRPYVEIPEKLSAAQLEKVHDSIEAMHKKGWTLGDDVQVGLHAGEPVLFDVGKSEKSDSAHGRERDEERLAAFYRQSGHEYTPRGASLGKQWDAALRQITFFSKSPPEQKAKTAEKLKKLAAGLHKEAPDELEQEIIADDLKSALEKLGETSAAKEEHPWKGAFAPSKETLDKLREEHGPQFDKISTAAKKAVASFKPKHATNPDVIAAYKEADPSYDTSDLMTPSYAKRSQAEKVLHVAGHEVGAHFESTLTSAEKKFHEELLRSWHTSAGSYDRGGDGKPEDFDHSSQRLQGLAASLGVPGSASPEDEADDAASKGGARAAHANGAKDKKLSNYAAKVYAFQQAYFAHAGLKELTLYRGVKGDAPKEGESWNPPTRELSSFTGDPNVAKRFGHVIAYKVPASHILTSSLVHPYQGSETAEHSDKEAEFIVMGASKLKGEVHKRHDAMGKIRKGKIVFTLSKARKLHRRREFQGLQISIENQTGSYRHWYCAHENKRGKTKMLNDYGYIRRTEGLDDEHVDVYVGPNKDAMFAFVVTQMKPPDFLEIDEQKVMLGFDRLHDAAEAYKAHYDDDRFLGEIRMVPMADFKAFVLDPKNHGELVKSYVVMRGAPEQFIPDFATIWGIGKTTELEKKQNKDRMEQIARRNSGRFGFHGEVGGTPKLRFEQQDFPHLGMDVEKSGTGEQRTGHKYIRRVPNNRGGYYYIYAEGTHGPHGPHGSPAPSTPHPHSEKNTAPMQPIQRAPHSVNMLSSADNVKPYNEEMRQAKAKEFSSSRKWVTSKMIGLPEDTKNAHSADGGYTPERQQLHAQILAKFADEVKPVPKDQKPTAIVTMGGPASGKGSVLGALIGNHKDFVLSDPDACKEQLPEYQRAVQYGEHEGMPVSAVDAAAMAHEESSDLADAIREKAVAERKNVVVDGTGKNAEKFMARIKDLQKAGYHVKLVLPHAPMKTASSRAQSRATGTGRYVPDEIVEQAHHLIPGNFEKIARVVDDFHLFDNSDKPRVVWTGGKDQPDTVHDPDFVAKFKLAGKHRHDRARKKGWMKSFRFLLKRNV